MSDPAVAAQRQQQRQQGLIAGLHAAFAALAANNGVELS